MATCIFTSGDITTFSWVCNSSIKVHEKQIMILRLIFAVQCRIFLSQLQDSKFNFHPFTSGVQDLQFILNLENANVER